MTEQEFTDIRSHSCANYDSFAHGAVRRFEYCKFTNKKCTGKCDKFVKVFR